MKKEQWEETIKKEAENNSERRKKQIDELNRAEDDDKRAKAPREKELPDAEKEYQDAHEALIRIQENINTLNGELCDAPESDMEQLEREKDAAQHALADAAERRNAIYARLQNNRKQQEKLQRNRARIPHDE